MYGTLTAEEEKLLRDFLSLKEQQEREKWIENHKELFEAPEVYRDRGAMYSGWDGANRKEAEAFCEEQSGIILEMLPGGKILEAANLYNTVETSEANVLWTAASQIYAGSLEGNVHSFSHQAKTDRVLVKDELPVLLDKENEKVTGINDVKIELLREVWESAEDKNWASSRILQQVDRTKLVEWDGTKPESELHKDKLGEQEKIEKAKLEEQKKEESQKQEPPKEKTKAEIEKEEKIAQQVVGIAIEEAKKAVIGATVGPVGVAAYEAQKAYDEAKAQEQEKQNQDAEQTHKVKFNYEGRKGTIEINAPSYEEAKERVKALFENEEFRDQLKARDLKPGESLSGKAEIAQLPQERPRPLFSTEPEKKKDDLDYTIKNDEPNNSL